MKELELIEINYAKPLNMYIQHMEKLFHVEVQVGDTYNDLFSKLTERVATMPTDIQEAAKDWIDYNKEAQEDHSVFDTVVITSNESGYQLYAIFNARSLAAA